MEQLAISPKPEPNEPQAEASFVTCKLCLVSSSEMRLSFRNLSEFYAIFKPCGVGVNIMEMTHYNWVCAYCWTRASQCLQFVEMARRAEYIFHNILRNEPITEAKLKQASEGYVIRTVNLSPCVIVTDPEEAELTPAEMCEVPTASANEDVKIEYRKCDSHGDEFSDLQGDNITRENQTVLKSLQTEKNDNMDFIEYEYIENASTLSVEQDCCKEEDITEVCAKEKQAKKSSVKVEIISREEQLTATKAKHLSTDSEKVQESLRLLQMAAVTLSEEEQREELAARRQTEQYRAWRYKCESCAVGYHVKESIEKHNLQHKESAGPYLCEMCHRRFETRRRLTSHTRRSHRLRYRCLHCAKSVKDMMGVQLHYVKCMGIKPLACDQCPKVFYTRFRLRNHISMKHNSNIRYECDVCGRKFPHKQNLKDHIRIHTQVKSFGCPICGKKSSSFSNNKLHISTHAGPTEPKEQRYCVECDKYFKTKKNLDMHLTNSSKHVTDRKHTCNICSKNFSSKGILDAHIKVVHLNTRDFSCDQCDKNFSLERLLRKHIKSKHTERTRDHVCAVCNVAFFTKTTLRNHNIGVHERRRPYECGICGETFGYEAALYTHRKLKHKITNKGSGSTCSVKSTKT